MSTNRLPPNHPANGYKVGQRINEPSSWSAIAAMVMGSVLASNAPELATPEFVGGVVAVATGLLGFFKREKGNR